MKARLLPLLAAMVVLGLAGCDDPPKAGSSSEKSTPANETAASPNEAEIAAKKAEEEAKANEAAAEEKVKAEKAAGGAGAASSNATQTVATDKPKSGDEVGVIETAKGRIVVMFRPDKAPMHVQNFKELAGKKFYDGTRFHRCIAGFMIQGGDPNSKDLSKSDRWGTGGNMVNGAERMIKLEPSDLNHKRGVLSMARSQDPDSASSQFFIMQADNADLDTQYSAFGKVVSGMEVVDKIVITGDAANNGAVDPKYAVVVKSIRITRWPVK
jgi:peptidyl-prolyl cis-trans isomerase B (cyclophilin B)